MHKRENYNLKNESIALVGMPGSGKSTIGRLAATQIACHFYDSDKIIEDKEQKNIPEIFEINGEPYFRNLEKEVISDVLNSYEKPFILSTGGGAMMTEETEKILLSKSYLIFLEASFETLWNHVRQSHGSRPLLHGDEDEAKNKLQNLLEIRLPIYRKAHCIINCDDKSLEDVVKDLIQEITKND